MLHRRGSEEALPTGVALRQSSVTSKGQTTIPAEIRRELRIEPGDKVSFSLEGGRVFIEKVQEIDHAWNGGQSLMLSEWNDPEQDVYND
jgi:AbrB family looped-hinge helix DNA binding protein